MGNLSRVLEARNGENLDNHREWGNIWLRTGNQDRYQYYIFDLLRDKGYGLKMKVLLSQLSSHLAGCKFVDIADIMQIRLPEDDYFQREILKGFKVVRDT